MTKISENKCIFLFVFLIGSFQIFSFFVTFFHWIILNKPIYFHIFKYLSWIFLLSFREYEIWRDTQYWKQILYCSIITSICRKKMKKGTNFLMAFFLQVLNFKKFFFLCFSFMKKFQRIKKYMKKYIVFLYLSFF